MKTVVITDVRTREARDAASFLEKEGYRVAVVPENVPIWQEEPLKAWAAGVAEELAGVIHPAPPAFLSPLLETTEEEFARARDEGPLAAWCVTKVFGGILREKGEGCLIYLGSIHAEKPVGGGFLFSAGCGAGAGVAWLQGGRFREIAHTVVNAVAVTSGIVCDGAKASCAAKIAAAVDAGLLGLAMVRDGNEFYGGDGIVKKGVENTIAIVGRLARNGMLETDKEIIRLMLE